MRRLLVVLSLCLGLPGLAWAEFFVCGNAPRSFCADTPGLTQVLPSIDPTKVTDPLCSQVPEAQIAAQRTLMQTVAASHPNGRCHLTVVSGLAAEMTQPEKDVVDAAIQAVKDEQQAYEDAVTNNDLCHATLTELDQKKQQLASLLQSDIDAISNITTAKTELTDMMTRLVNALDKLMRCIRGRAGPPAN